MPERLCPKCGHSPIRRGTEACPACHEPDTAGGESPFVAVGAGLALQ